MTDDYVKGGIIGAPVAIGITWLMYGSITWVSALFSALLWPFVMVFGFIVLVFKVLGFLWGLVF